MDIMGSSTMDWIGKVLKSTYMLLKISDENYNNIRKIVQ